MRNRKHVVYLLMLVASVSTVFAQSYTATVNDKMITAASASTGEAAELHLGRYELYSGIPTMYLGHFILLANGKYKVAFNTDETDYDESGTYKYNKDTNTIEWISGMFKNNNWGGKITQTDKGYHIQFNKATYGDSK